MTNGNVLGFMGAPDREVSLRAVSLALLKVRALPDVTCEKLGKTLDCSADTIRGATNELNLLSLDSALRLCWFFPDESKALRELIDPFAGELTAADHRDAIERHARALARLADAA